MIVTDTVQAKAEVDVTLADNAGLADSVFHYLTRAVIAEGENIGAFIGPDSTYMRRGEPLDRTFTIPFIAYWCPDPTLGVEFRGGPNDGKVLPIPRGEDGRPFEQVRLPPEPTASEFTRPGTYPVTVMDAGVYERIGIDSVLDRWVYQHITP